MAVQDAMQEPSQTFEYDWSATETVLRHCIDQFEGEEWIPTTSGFQAVGMSGNC